MNDWQTSMNLNRLADLDCYQKLNLLRSTAKNEVWQNNLICEACEKPELEQQILPESSMQDATKRVHG